MTDTATIDDIEPQAVAGLTMTDYTPPGPVADAFLSDRTNMIRGIMGPQGSGKTNAVIADILTNAFLMPPCLDGVRRYRHLVIRETYLNLNKSFLPSWWTWFPKTAQNWSGGGDRPATQKLLFEIEPGSGDFLDFEINFLAIGDQRAEDVLRGVETTAATIDEADLLSPDVLTYVIGRIGRWPPMRTMLRADELSAAIDAAGGVEKLTVDHYPPHARFRRYVTMAFNAPDVDNYCYKLFVEDKPANVGFYQQPSGLAAKAENLRNLPPGYYADQVTANRARPWWIRRMVENQFGYSQDGEPVYPMFRDEIHISPEPLKPAAGVPFSLGLDAGGHPAAVITQWMPDGQWRVIDEVYVGRAGAKVFVDHLKARLRQMSARPAIRDIYVDPSAYDGADKESDELAWADTVQAMMREFKMPIQPAPSNEIELRLEAVRQQLSWRLDGDRPGLLVSPVCKVLRKGFNSHYRFKKAHGNATVSMATKPEKNEYANPQDALQYVILGSVGKSGVIEQSPAFREQRRASQKPVIIPSYQMFGARR